MEREEGRREDGREIGRKAMYGENGSRVRGDDKRRTEVRGSEGEEEEIEGRW